MGNVESGRVIVGIGRSPGGYQALRYALAEARRRRTALIAVRAFRLATYDQMLSIGLHMESATAQAGIAAAEALGGWPEDVAVDVLVREGDTACILVSIANREADLLVIGGCGVRRPWHVRSTAVARFCARSAVCPVVIVPPNSLARSANADRLAHDTAHDVEEYLSSQAAR